MTLHIDGFEQYANETGMQLALTRSDYGVVGGWTSVSGRGRFSRALSGQGASMSRSFGWTQDKFSIGFAATFTGRGSMAWLTIGGADLTFWLNPDSGLPNLNTAVGGALPTKNRYYFYEIEIDRATGACSLYINNRFDCVFNIAGAPLTASAVGVSLGYRAPADYRQDVTPVPLDSSVKTFDDFYMRDGARLGPIMITTRFPDADEHVEWFKAGTNTTHAATLAQLPPAPLDNYVAADTVGKEDRFSSTQDMSNTNSIVATGIVVLARKSPTVDAKLGVFIDGGVTARSGTRTVESEWRTQFVCFEATAGDTPANIKTSKFGINVSPS